MDLNELIDRVIDGRYRIDGLIAFGGMGAVFRANHLALGYDVALKVLHPQLAEDEATCKRFEREAYSASLLNHPNCIKVHDYGSTVDGVTYMAMELLEGAELRTLLDEPMTPTHAVERMIQILEGLEHAHEQGVIHRDLKPANIYITHDSRGREVLKIVDFGIAKVLTDRKPQERLTLTGMVYGTPHYMSPEQCTGGQADARSDLYAAGLIFYRMIAGRAPFQAEDGATLMRMQVLSPPDPLPPETPRVLAHVVERLLRKDPGDRYSSAREVIGRLEGMRPLLAGIAAARPGPPPPGASLVAAMPSPTQSSDDGDTARMGAGSWQEAAATAGRGGARAAPARRQASVIPWIGMAVALALAGGATGLLLWQRADYEDRLADLQSRVQELEPPIAAAEPSDPVAAAPEIEIAAATALAPMPAPPALPSTVSLAIRTNVEAAILDAADMGAYGRTNQAEAVQVERSDQPLALILRAPGYRDRPLELVPDQDRQLDVDLAREGRKGKSRAGKARDKPAAAPTPKPKWKAAKSIDDAKPVDPWGG
jgi:hypothetical protein